jgi:ABC-type phosphate transport system substrate-binding protein
MLVFFFLCKTISADTSLITMYNDNVNSIAKKDVKLLYLMKRRNLSNGGPVIIYQMPVNSILHKKFVRDILDMSIEQYNQVINQAVNSGLNRFIITVETREEMINKVSETNNSIGYIDSDYLIINSISKTVSIYKIID